MIEKDPPDLVPSGQSGHDRTVQSLSTARAALRATALRLAAAGIEDSSIDARHLVLSALQCKSIDLVRSCDRLLTSDEAMRIEQLVARRIAREPVSRIVGERGFYGRTFHISPATLDPRPETETLVDAALALVKENGLDRHRIEIIDIGTGSGCILLSLLAELPLARGIGTDISASALAIASLNARLLRLADRARFVEGRDFAGCTGSFELVVSNPPYISSADIDMLAPEVRLHDPKTALDGGADGLVAFRSIAAEARERARGGWLLFEVGAGQASAVADLVAAAFRAVAPSSHKVKPIFFRDYGGIERCVAISTQF